MIESSLTNGGAIKLYTPSPIGQLMVYSHHHSATGKLTEHKASKACCDQYLLEDNGSLLRSLFHKMQFFLLEYFMLIKGSRFPPQ